jgi:hypothetical protein
MEDLIKTLPMVLGVGNASDDVSEAAVFAAWKHVAGSGIRQHAQPLKLEAGSLVVAVRDHVWQQQLSIMNTQMIYRVNSLLGKPLVKNIELRIDAKSLPSITSHKVQTEDVQAHEVPIDLWAAASEIQDKQLRQKFLKAAIGMLRRKSDML